MLKAMATFENYIVNITKYFMIMLTDSNTLITFMLEIADIYEVNSVTIIADKEWVLIEILDFLESKIENT
ncbi:hypothetical protein HYE21_00860 [Mycoplasmopsis bovis]|nr:hypothetical protein HYE21_00860 [Mycoplasmopsis bovis]